eukprot:TRINITY_DN88064_c2_g1_i1.p1 TRINITY_DN88064_c2_g1~~TRINITY_DN88064_c2_g1_i1.p1  ORF type:complete len:825 (-),score=106.77 TRINITY_DN88064_c2_g1_i1:1366-3840(-)
MEKLEEQKTGVNPAIGGGDVDAEGTRPMSIEERYAQKGTMKIAKVRNTAAAPIQITAEQLIAESQAHRTDDVKAPKQWIQDEEELSDYKLRRRTEFENTVRRQRIHIGNWLKYAKWEESIGEIIRARSIYERALEVDPRNITIYLKYVEMEMKHKFINHARNIWERACRTLPMVEQFWYKYAYMEEVLGNYTNAREIFRKWMTWKPSKNAWWSYLKFEERMGELDNCRKVLNEFIDAYPEVETYVKAAKFEEKLRNRDNAREYYQLAIKELGERALDEKFFMQFINFEKRNREVERVRTLYQFALEHIPKEKARHLYDTYIQFEKEHGSKDSIETVILNKRRHFYEQEIAKNPLNYDNWFDYARLEESTNDPDRAREIYERGISNIPPIEEKSHWKRYIFLWLNYAIFEELQAKSFIRAKEVYEKAVQVIPHEKFTFSKLWIQYAQLHIRQKDLDGARKVYGHAIGRCPREKMFKSYVEMELQLGNVDRCRKIYEKYIEVFPELSNAWIQYAQLEASLEELDRARAIYDIAVEQNLDMPENVWKSYIDMEIGLSDFIRARKIYARLMTKSKHVKVWLSYATFESSIGENGKARKVYADAYDYFKEEGMTEERVIVLDAWMKFEAENGDKEHIEFVKAKMPKRIKKRRKVTTMAEEPGKEGEEAGWEEYFDYIFPDDQGEKRNLKILEMAYKWKEQQKDATKAEGNVKKPQQQQIQPYIHSYDGVNLIINKLRVFFIIPNNLYEVQQFINSSILSHIVFKAVALLMNNYTYRLTQFSFPFAVLILQVSVHLPLLCNVRSYPWLFPLLLPWSVLAPCSLLQFWPPI